MTETIIPQERLPDYPTHTRLKGQTALVTGANSGIGEGVAIELAKAGCNVMINYIAHPEIAQNVCEKLRSYGVQAQIIQADVSKEAEVQKMFQHTLDTFGSLDILVNNAGIQRDAPIDEMTLEQWNIVIGVNLTGYFLCAREAVRIFKKQPVNQKKSCALGKIVFVSSVHEMIPWAGHANYASSKGGIMMLMKSLAQELAPHRIRVNSVCPGAIQTPINKDAWDTPEAYNKLLELIPYKRIGQPQDIGRAVSWLVSDDADYVNGLSLFVDGGMTLFPGFTTNG